MSEATEILQAIAGGDHSTADRLLPLVYEELRRLAAARLARESPGQTLQPTALVHEAYVRLVGGGSVRWNGEGHFFAAAAEAMRRILIERARRKQTARHGGHPVSLDGVDVADDAADDDLLALDEALEDLAREEPVTASVVKLRYYAGLTTEQAAAALGLSLRTANRHWAFARARLYRRLRGGEDWA